MSDKVWKNLYVTRKSTGNKIFQIHQVRWEFDISQRGMCAAGVGSLGLNFSTEIPEPLECKGVCSSSMGYPIILTLHFINKLTPEWFEESFFVDHLEFKVVSYKNDTHECVANAIININTNRSSRERIIL